MKNNYYQNNKKNKYTSDLSNKKVYCKESKTTHIIVTYTSCAIKLTCFLSNPFFFF